MRPAKFLLLTGICGEQSTHSLVSRARLWKGSETEHSGSWDLQFRSTQLSSSTGPCCRLWQRPPLLLVSIVHFHNYVWNVDLHWCLEWWFKLHDRGVTEGWGGLTLHDFWPGEIPGKPVWFPNTGFIMKKSCWSQVFCVGDWCLPVRSTQSCFFLSFLLYIFIQTIYIATF